MQQIDPRPAYDGVNRSVEDIPTRLNNWELLVRNIRGFYSDVLQQLLTMRLPNIGLICREPGKDLSFAEIRKALLLILGCAVQCEQKEAFIDRIMAMDIGAQTEIVENIKEVTDDYETILPTQRPESPTSSGVYLEKTFHHLHRLIKERDQCAELISDLGQERDFYMSQAEGKPLVEPQQLSPDKHHLALELAECKAKLRHVRQELEDRQEQLTDMKEELQESMSSCSQLKNENASLLQEARTTRSLKDELDILKEKSSKVDMYEKEILKYKERLNELEFYKARTEELKEDNSILEETKAMLEDQLTNSRKRIETVVELETELGKYRQQIEEYTRERNSDREKIDYLTSENARLEFEKKSSMNESASLETELSAARSRIGNMGGSLSEQLSETSHARVLRLELENQRLSAKLAEMKESALIQSAEISLELEKENQRLAKRVEKLQSSACEASEQVIQMESDFASVKEEKERLTNALDAVKENSERQVRELERENEQLSQALDNIRERSEKTSDVRVKDLERENKRLHEVVSDKNSALNKLEFETRQLQRMQHQLQGNTERVKEVEQENQSLEKENSELHQKVATLQHSAERLEAVEQENSDMGVENRKLQKTVESLQASTQRREQLEQEHISLSVEHQRLQRTIESLRGESDRALELETEKAEVEQELQQLRKQLEGQKVQKLKQEQMEFEIIDMSNENQRLQKSLEVTTRRLQQLEKDNNDIEMESERLSKELDTMKVAVKRLDGRDKEASQMEVEMQRLQKDKAGVEKENRKLKQTAELKDSSLEEINAKFVSLDRESKSLRQSVDKMKETCAKVREMEKENKELLQELNTDRRTLATLREDLVNEKIHSQELSNELDQLRGELEKVGINTQKLTMAEQTNDANRYKALESMIEETLQKSNELKEEKIRSLESRLEESKNRNTKLQESLRGARQECEVLKQRCEEEEIAGRAAASAGTQRVRLLGSNSSNSAKEVFEMKDHLVELERNNATLLAENDNLRSNNGQLSNQCQKLEGQLSSLQSQSATLQGQYTSLKEQNAKLQVEYSTLQSQTTSSLSLQDSLKHQLSRLESDHENLGHKHEDLLVTHRSLLTDHESLQHLHNQLTSEYEALVSEHGSLKSLHKSLKGELRDAQDQLDTFLQGKDDVNKLRDLLEHEREQLKRELLSVGNLQADYSRLHDDHKQMQAAYDKLSQDYSDMLGSHKQVKTDYNTLQLKSTEQQGDLNEAKENLSVAEVEFQKLENKMDAVYQINERLENENQALLLQIQQLLNQNQELLTQALNSKDHFAEEEKAYLEKLSDLRRQKERLEEKIMDHYKNRISPKKKGFGALLARKARGIISRTPKRSKSRNNLSELNDNSSQGSGSTEQTNDAHRLDKQRQSSSGPYADASPKLANQNKSLAKSYTALHSPVFDNEKSELRGAKSTEDVRDGGTGDTGLLPGLGRPYTMDQVEGGNGGRSTTPGLGRRTPGRSSPGSEMLTLDQFLKEANKSPRNNANNSNENSSNAQDEMVPQNAVQRRRSNDSESRSSDNSNTSANKQLQYRHQQHQQQRHPSASTSSSSLTQQFRPDIPDVASSSHNSLASALDPNSSRLSRNSSGTIHDSFGSSGMLPGDIYTSTPKAEQDVSASSLTLQSHFNGSPTTPVTRRRDPSADRPLSQKRLSGEDWRNSAHDYSSTNRLGQFGQPSSSSPRTPRSSSSASSQSYQQSQPPLGHTHPHKQMSNPQSSFSVNSSNNNSSSGSSSINSSKRSSRELPPAPTEPPPPIPATERLDRLTMLSSGDPMPPSHYASPNDLPINNNNSDHSGHHPWGSQYRDPRKSESPRATESDFGRGGDMSAEIQRRKSQGAADKPQGLPNQFQPPIPRSQPGVASGNDGPQRIMDSSVVSGHNPRRPPANTMTFQNNPQARARPASVMGSSPHVRGVISRPPGEGRPRSQLGGPTGPPLRRQSAGRDDKGNLHGDQNSNNSNNHQYSRPHTERPKSVPPQLFNKSNDPGGSSGVGYPPRDMPVPPPRRGRDQLMRDERGSRDDPDGGDFRDIPPQQQQQMPSVSLIREPSRPGSRPSVQSMIRDQEGQMRPQQHSPGSQQMPGRNPSLGGARQNSTGSLPSPLQDPRTPRQHESNNPSSSRPNTMGQNSSRPDSLPLTSHREVGQLSHSANSNHQSGYGTVGGRAQQDSYMTRSQSSLGRPVSSAPSVPQGVPYGRSNTPGPQPVRREPPRNTLPPRDVKDGSRPLRDFSGSGYQPTSNASGPGFDPGHDAHRASGQFRGGSEPRDMPAGPSRGGVAATHGYPPPAHQDHRGVDPKSNYHNPPLAPAHHHQSHSQGPPSHRGSVGGSSAVGSSRVDGISNGPVQPQYGNSNLPPPPPNSSQQQQHQQNTNSIPPQIRSQGKPVLNSPSYGPPPLSSSNKGSQQHPSQMRGELGDLCSPDQGPSIPQSLPSPGPMKSPGGQNPPPPADNRDAGDGTQPKHSNSIWRPRWS
ncbi:girdin [Aplysia californica]|uniref:Girdin n=1 Tax=Aplysia californica TaxID=6500 RepID=A0ABM0JW85_APLCA|nr:girdin [Aplysia californica]